MKMIASEHELRESLAVLGTACSILEVDFDLDEIMEFVKSNPEQECEVNPYITLTYDKTKAEFTYEIDERLMQIQNKYAVKFLIAVKEPLRALANFINVTVQLLAPLRVAYYQLISEMEQEIEQLMEG